MNKIRQDIIDHILSVARIEEVIADFEQVKLRKKGVRYEGICPFHDDKGYGNFSVYPKENCYKCFKCEAAGGVVDFLMKHAGLSYPDAIRYLGKKYSIEVDDVALDYTPPPPRPLPPPLPTLTLPWWFVNHRKATDTDNLVAYLKTGIRWGNEQRARIDKVLEEYHVGHSTIEQRYERHEFTMFWQIDSEDNVRTAKLMKFHPKDSPKFGHRIKEKDAPYVTDWLHAILERTKLTKYYDPEKQEARQCLFGEHLLNCYPKATIKLVESEKTAIIMATAYGNNAMQVWMACGGLSGLSRERLKPLLDQQRQIILYPDRDGVKKWKQKADGLYYSHITVDDQPVTKWWKPEDGDTADIADVVTRMLNQAPPPAKTLDELKEQVPIVAPMIDKLNLTIQDNEQ